MLYNKGVFVASILIFCFVVGIWIFGFTIGRTYMTSECKCLEIIDARLDEINKKSTPFEPMTEQDFHEIQALLKIYVKIQEANNNK